MKNKKAILSLVLAVCFMLSSLLFSGCSLFNDNYLAVIPTDQYFKSTLSYSRQNDTSDYLENWIVIRKQATICGETRDVYYVEYSFTDNDGRLTNYSRTLLYFYDGAEGRVFLYDGSSWQKYQGSFGDKWSDIFGSMNKPGSFVYEMTDDINGRDFPKKYKTETTNEYIEYTFNSYEEKFRISNDPYHILLYYNFEYQQTHIKKEATISYGEPNDVIPRLETITQSMITD